VWVERTDPVSRLADGTSLEVGLVKNLFQLFVSALTRLALNVVKYIS